MLNNLTRPRKDPANPFDAEWIGGSEKTTQLARLAKWPSAEGQRVFATEWNSSALVKAATRSGRKKSSLAPMTFSLPYATEYADRRRDGLHAPRRHRSSAGEAAELPGQQRRESPIGRHEQAHADIAASSPLVIGPPLPPS
jgi:hypothetical protein